MTLDYGENTMHAALDRLQVTLWAYGRIFTQGPGSSYNAPTNFKRGDKKAMAFISHDSLSNNVVMVDGANQAPAIGRLISWQPAIKSPAGACQAAAAEVEGHYPGVAHKRAVFLVRQAVVVLDDLSSDRDRTWDFVYHNFGKLTPGEGWQARPHPKALGTKANYPNIRDLHRLQGSGNLTLQWDLEGLKLDFWQAASGGETYTGLTGLNSRETATVGDDVPSVFVRNRGKAQRFATVLQPLKGENPVASIKALTKKKEFGVAINFKDGQVVRLVFRPAEEGKEAILVQ